MTYQFSDLVDFGWTSFFSSQIESHERTTTFAVKVVEAHRGTLRVVGLDIDKVISAFTGVLDNEETPATVGDWLLLDTESHQVTRLLPRVSVFKRPAPGAERKMQLIAANIDTLFIVTSCNQDFNPARLERYLVLAAEAGVKPIIVLTKADLIETSKPFIEAAAKLLPNLAVEVLDARNSASVTRLSRWCARGHTVAVVGSSGVGKSTLVNTLLGSDKIETQHIREDDAKGRHTTTGRTFYPLPAGGWLLDTPGMRGLDVSEAGGGIEIVFSDIIALTHTCRFNDCKHDTEPGCAIQSAIASGTLDAERLKRWKKLTAEEAGLAEVSTDRSNRIKGRGKFSKAKAKMRKGR